jgi:hypothetical protein
MKKIIIFALLTICTFCFTAKSQSLNFDGADDYVDVSTNTNIPVGNNNYTIETWFNATAMGTEGIIGWGDYNNGGNNVNALRLTGNGIVNYWWGNDLAIVTGDISGAWHHVAVTYDGTTRSIYLDGVLSGSDTPGANNVPFSNNLTIGRTWTSEYFNGSIDELRIWNVVRTQGQIQDNMNCSIPGGKPGLVANYNFNAGTPNGNNAGVTTLNDVSTFLNNGTLTNFALTGTTSNWVNDVNLISPVASLTVSAGVTSVCQGTTVTFTATPTNGGDMPYYQWFKNGSPVGTDSAHYSDNTLLSSDLISCYLVSSISCANSPNSNTVSITVPAITVTGNNGICSGTTSTLTATGMTTYTWSANAGSATTSTVAITPNATDTYTVTGFNGTCVATTTANLHVTPTPTLNVTGNSSICVGATATLTANGASNYTWTPGNAYTATVVTPTLSTNTTYTLVGNSAICSSTITGTIVVSPSPTLTITGGTPICSGSSVILNVGTATTYTWSANAGGSTASTVTVSPTTTDTYTVSGANGGCVKTQTVIISVTATPTLSIFGTTSICNGNNTILTAAGGSTYTWSANAGSANTNTVNVNPTSTDSYTVSSDNGGCSDSKTVTVNVVNTPTINITGPTMVCSGNSVILNASGTATYTWSSNAGSANTSSVSITPNTTDTYTVSGDISGVCPTVNQTITVTYVTTPTVSITGTSTICAGDSTTLTGSGATSYTWSANAAGVTTDTARVSPAATGTFVLIGEDGGCYDKDSVVVNVNPLPAVVFDMNPNLYCSTDPTVTLTPTPSGGTFTGAGVNAGQFDPNSAGVGSYTLSYSYTDINSCTNTDTASVTVQMCSMDIHKFYGYAFSIYPNPTNDLITINSEHLPANSVLEIYNNLGQKVSSVVLSSTSSQIEISNLANGIYEARIISNNTITQQTKIVKH